MPRNGSGIYGPPAGTAAVPNTTIESADYNSVVADMSQALTDSINVDGTAPFQGDQPMGDNKLTGLGTGSAASDSLTLGQAQSSIVAHATAVGGTADAITATFSPAFNAWTAKMRFRFTAGAANATATPTINVDGLGARTIRKLNGQALETADIAGSGHVCECIYNGTDVILLNFAPMTANEANAFTTKQIFNRPIIAPFTTLADAATIAWDMEANSVNVKIMLSASRNLGLPTNLNAGQSGLILVQQDATGGWSLSPNAVFKQPGGQTVFDLDKAANTKTIYAYQVTEDHTAAKVVLLRRLWSEGKNSIGFYKDYDEGSLDPIATLTRAHGLGRFPSLVILFFQCSATDRGYAVGDRILAMGPGMAGNSVGSVLTASADATNVYIARSTVLHLINNKNTGESVVMQSATNWRLIIRVYE